MLKVLEVLLGCCLIILVSYVILAIKWNALTPRQIVIKILCRLHMHPWRGIVSEEGHYVKFCKNCFKTLSKE